MQKYQNTEPRTTVMLKFRHRGVPKYVGKVFRITDTAHGRPIWIFCHEESGSQSHRNLDSPGGIDSVVLHWLVTNGVQEVHHIRKRGTAEDLWIARTTSILQKAPLAHSDGRERYYLPFEQWRHADRWYKIPWIKREMVIDEDDIDPEALRAFLPVSPEKETRAEQQQGQQPTMF